jgi:uroporphyrinogen-III synthase
LRALITRPREDAEEIAGPLRERGIEPVIVPMLDIAFLPDPVLDLSGVQALLFTSANGVRAFAAACGARALPVFAVGDATAAEARRQGFASVQSAAGDVSSLTSLVIGNVDPKAGALLHVAGSAVAGDLAGQLGAEGFLLRRAVLYEARPAAGLSENIEEALQNKTIDIVLFFSPRTAATFVTLIRKAGLETACRAMTALCLSAAVAKAAGDLPWRDMRCARRADGPAMIDEVDAILRQARG